MIRFALVPTILGALALAAPAAAQTPQPHPPGFLNSPAGRATPHPLHGRACNGGVMANRAATTINPVTGKPEPKAIVVVPLTKNGGGVANATTRAAQAEACAHPTH